MPLAGAENTAPSAAPSLRETIEASYDAVEKAQSAPADVAPATPDAAAPATPAPDAAPAPADTRARDDSGRFVEQKDKPAPKPAPKTAAPTAVAPAALAARKRPSSWKPELDPHWATLPKEVQDEIERREGDFIKGVSTYKAEYDRVKPIDEALRPYQPMMQQYNIKPEQFVSALAATHQTLTSGSKEEKLKAFAKFSQDYGISLNELLIQGDDGKVYLNQSYFQPQQPAQPQTVTPQEVEKIVAQRLAKVQLQQHIDSFIAAKDGGGNPLYPHYKEVWTTMDGILRAGLAPDLPTAYAAALAMPQHSGLSAAQQEQQRKTAETEKARQQAEVVARAKANTVSPRNQTPTDMVMDKRTSLKGLRATIEEAAEAHLGGGRI